VYAALIGASVLWASLYTAAKPAVGVTGPMQVSLCRVCVAFLVLTPLVLARGGTSPFKRALRERWLAIIVLGLLNFGTSQILALTALKFLPASVNGVLNNTHPVWVAIGTAVLFPNRRPLSLIAGSGVALAGVAVVSLPDVLSETQAVSPIGVALSLAGSGVIAMGTVVGRRVMPGNDPMAVSALASCAAILPLFLLSLANGGLAPIFNAALDIKLLLLYLGVGCTAMNFVLWYYGLKHLNAAAASAFQYLIPPIGVVLAATFLGEPITPALVVGTALILAGLGATQLASARAPRAVSA
jgi:drug/metabolite transporter (DMT)-like permease